MKTRSFCLSIVSAFALWHVTSAAAATTKSFVVTSAAGGNATAVGTLTWAIYQVNYQGGDINYINFNIPRTSGEVEITLTETLYLARPVVINGATEPGYSGQPLIRINCNRLDSGFCLVANVAGIPPLSTGAPSTGGGSTIQGFRIINYNSNAITILKGADSNLIANNYIGFAPLPDGTYFRNTSVTATCRGIGIESNNNVISGNTISGVHNAITLGFDINAATTPTCKNNSFDHNFIGTDPTGTTKIGNDSDGIFLGAGAQANVIGPANVLSGMASSGVELLHQTATDNIIFGNLIGLNAAGTDVIPNGELGVLIANGASNNWIGGPYGGAYAGNIISGNPDGAVAIGTPEFPGPDGSNNNHVEGNFIGTDGTKSKALGTETSGVTVQTNSKGNIVRKNVIVGQVNHGVVFADANNNAMYGNWIGVTDHGTVIPNGGFGAYLFDASNNTVQLSAASAAAGTEQNVFGSNTTGPIGVYGTSVGDVIDLTAPPTGTPTPARLLNISTRLRVESGDNALIVGFIITGSSPKKVMLRGLGTSLTVAGALADPTLQLNTSGGSIFNDNWRSTQEQEIIASGIAPTSDLEAAIVATLNPGAYTAVLRGKGDTTGVGLVEVYDLDSPASAVLANISTRGVVQSGDNVMIAGFILGGGETGSRVAIRALGQSLQAAGVSNTLNDPTLQLVDSNGAVVQRNDNWQDDASQASQLTTLGLAPSNVLESAIVATLAPGAYTSVVADRNGTSGTGLVEVYNVP
jgi:hypothetical protein